MEDNAMTRKNRPIETDSAEEGSMMGGGGHSSFLLLAPLMKSHNKMLNIFAGPVSPIEG